MEYFDKDDPQGAGSTYSLSRIRFKQKTSITFDGKKYTEGLPDMEWKDGKVVG